MFIIFNPIVTVGVIVMISAMMTAAFNYKKWGKLAFNRFIGGAVIAVIGLFFPQPASAQEPPPLPPDPLTTFRADCQTVEGESLVIRWGYEANGSYNWAGQGLEFTTAPGSYPQVFEYVTPLENPQLEPLGLGRWVSYPDDPAYDLIAGGLVESVFVDLMPDDLAICGAEPTPTPEPPATPTPAPDTCPAWSIDAATGGLICLWDLPLVGGYQ